MTPDATSAARLAAAMIGETARPLLALPPVGCDEAAVDDGRRDEARCK
jgi:hypothetical protein